MDLHSFSFGFVAGIMLKWTDLIPITGGFIIGFSIQRIPDITTKIPEFLTSLYDRITIKKKEE
jgi:hypothetical protein